MGLTIAILAWSFVFMLWEVYCLTHGFNFAIHATCFCIQAVCFLWNLWILFRYY